MAKNKAGLNLVDSWTSNGHGVTSNEKLTPEQKKYAQELNAEAAAKKAKAKQKKK